jgi:hypothetical protein
MDVTGFTDAQSAAIAGILNLASPGLRGVISATIGTALKGNVGGPLSDAAVLAAVGAALVRYGGM